MDRNKEAECQECREECWDGCWEGFWEQDLEEWDGIGLEEIMRVSEGVQVGNGLSENVHNSIPPLGMNPEDWEWCGRITCRNLGYKALWIRIGI